MSYANKKLWFLGYGSNMDSENLSKKKGVTVFQSTPAKIKGYKLAFSLNGPPKVEPYFANCEKGDPSDSIHGVAFETDCASIERMDKVESGYDKAEVSLEAYDGRSLSGYVYVNKPRSSGDSTAPGRPSARYLRLLVNGAEAAGLSAEYVARLKATEVYRPDAETLAARERATATGEELPLKEMTAESLGADPAGFVSVLGYVFNTGSRGFFGSHRGREVTNRNVRHFLNLPLDAEAGDDPQDDPERFPSVQLLKERNQEALDYVWTWFDHYVHVSGGSVVARHSGFARSQSVDPATGKPRSRWAYPA